MTPHPQDYCVVCGDTCKGEAPMPTPPTLCSTHECERRRLAMERLRGIESEVEAAYDTIDALTSAPSPPDEGAMTRAVEALDDALKREAAAAREVLDSRMSSLERTADSASRADKLCAAHSPTLARAKTLSFWSRTFDYERHGQKTRSKDKNF